MFKKKEVRIFYRYECPVELAELESEQFFWSSFFLVNRPVNLYELIFIGSHSRHVGQKIR